MRIGSICCVIFTSIFLVGDFTGVYYIANAESQLTNQVIVYYFHGNFRCVNCYNIEKFSKETAEQNFGNELSSNRLVFKAINIEEKDNEHFVNDYQLYTRSLVVSLVKNGKETKSKNLTKIWEYLKDKLKFHQYVKDEIREYLNEL